VLVIKGLFRTTKSVASDTIIGVPSGVPLSQLLLRHALEKVAMMQVRMFIRV
jgi:hypothetical protein